MASRNTNVAESWKYGEFASNHRGSFYTDGKRLYSYKLCIGFTSPSGLKIAIDHRAPNFVSQTTSCHVSHAARRATIVVSPSAVEEIPANC